MLLQMIVFFSFYTSVLSINFNLEPVRQRDLQSRKPVRQQLCLQYDLESKMTILSIESNGSIRNQIFRLEITDDVGSLIRRQDVSFNSYLAAGQEILMLTKTTGYQRF